MSSPQFMHIEAYPVVARPPKTRRTRDKCWGLKNILGEGLRIPGYHPHVEVPRLPEIKMLDSPVENPMSFEQWIIETMQTCREANDARLRNTALSIGTVIVSLPSDRDPKEVYDLQELSEQFFKRFLSHHDITLNYSIVHLDESHPHVHLWATPSKQQIDNKRWKLSSAFCLPGKDLRILQDLFWREVGEPLGLSRRAETPRGRRFDRHIIKMLAENPTVVRYSPQYEVGFLNALDALARAAALPPDLLFDVVRDELDEESVERLKARLAVPTVDDIADSPTHFTMRETEVEPKPRRKSYGWPDVDFT